MERKKLSNTDLNISPLGIGTVHYGTAIPIAEAELQLDTYLDMGGNLIDTAHVYGDWASDIPGISEVVIGDWLRKNGKRNKVIISTKGAHPRLDTMHIPRCAPNDIVSDIEASLKNLKTDYIDLYYLHRDDPSTEIGVILDCLESIAKSGKIRYYGCSNWSLERIKAAHIYAAKKGYTGFVCNQIMWSLADINPSGIQDKTLVIMDSETYDYHKETGLGVMAYSASAGGYFTKRAAGNVPDGFNEKYQNATNDRIFDELLKLNDESGISINRLGLLYVVSRPFTSIALAAFTNLGQLKDSSAIMAEDYSPDFVERLEKIKG